MLLLIALVSGFTPLPSPDRKPSAPLLLLLPLVPGSGGWLLLLGPSKEMWLLGAWWLGRWVQLLEADSGRCGWDGPCHVEARASWLPGCVRS
jgi:hypothetical protein